MFARTVSFLILIAFCFSIASSQNWVEEKVRQKRAFYGHKLSAEEEQIINFLDSTRSAKGIEPLDVNLKLSKAIKDRLERILNKQPEKDSISVVKELSDFMSFLGGKTFLIQGDSVPEILYKIGADQNVAKELTISDTITFGFSCTKDTIIACWHSLIYLTRYYVKFSPSEGKTFFSRGTNVQAHKQELIGKTNAKYIKYMIYQGDVLPFYYEGKEMIAEEIRTKEDGSFSLELSYYFKGATMWRVAIFAKNNKEELYSLVNFWVL